LLISTFFNFLISFFKKKSKLTALI